MSDIKSRLLHLLGPGPMWQPTNSDRTMYDGDAEIQFNKWRDALVDQLAKHVIYTHGFQIEDADNAWVFGETSSDDDTHSALLLDIQPIKRGVTKSSIIAALYDPQAYDRVEMAERIRNEGIINE
jgi:hypothetical protein